MPMICIGGAAVQGAVWKGEHGKLSRPLLAHSERMSKNEEIQPFLVAAWRHFVVGGDRLQELRRRQLWRAGTNCYAVALRGRRIYQRPDQQRRADDLFTVYAVLRRHVDAERNVLVVLVGGERGLHAAEYGFANAAGIGRHPLKRMDKTKRAASVSETGHAAACASGPSFFLCGVTTPILASGIKW
jgi:hypothetical protein